MKKDTRGSAYTSQLVKEQRKKIKDHLKWMNPYAIHVRKACEGRVLDVGCGIGRNLEYLQGRGTGVDHNPDSIVFAKNRGFKAFTVDELERNVEKEYFDCLLVAHVLEHMTKSEAIDLMSYYLNFLKPNGKIVIICPQEVGYKHDGTHVEFMNFDDIQNILIANKVEVKKKYSFPFFRFMGKFYVFNEFVVTAQKS